MRDFKFRNPAMRRALFVAAIGAAAAIGGSVVASNAASGAAAGASGALQGGLNEGIGTLRNSLDAVTAMLKPWVSSGTTALSGLMDLSGLNGAPQQAFALQQLQASPAFTSQQKLGENRILANASATGGLRGGNVQGALSQFNDSLLSGIIAQQTGTLSGLSNTGLGAATNTANATLSVDQQVAQAQGAIGQAQAGGILGQGQAAASLATGVANGVGMLAGGISGSGFGLNSSTSGLIAPNAMPNTSTGIVPWTGEVQQG